MSEFRENRAPFEGDPRASAGTPGGISRRALLKGAVAAAGAGLAGAVGVRAQVTGVMPGGGTIPLRLPMGALDYLDRKQYIHNMEIVSFTPGAEFSGGEPLMNMWAKGRQRMLPGGDGWLDISDPKKPVVIETAVRARGCIAYNTQIKKWIAMGSAGQPITRSRPDFPHGQHHEEERVRTNSYKGLRGIRT